MIAELIDKQDNVEIIRDQIAALLKIESANQVQLATDAAKPDPSLWALRVYQERANPWEDFPRRDVDETPIVNVWWDSSSFDPSSSDPVNRQKSDAVINLDCYGYGQSADDPAGGHTPGDLAASEACQRAVRLVRNILRAGGENTYLGLRGLVWGHWFDSITIMRPQQDDPAANRLVAARMALRVSFNEFSPQVAGETLELLTVQVDRAEDGEIIFNADYPYPLT